MNELGIRIKKIVINYLKVDRYLHQIWYVQVFDIKVINNLLLNI